MNDMVTYKIPFTSLDDGVQDSIQCTSNINYDQDKFKNPKWLEAEKAFIADEIWRCVRAHTKRFVNPQSVECVVHFAEGLPMILPQRVINAKHDTTTI